MSSLEAPVTASGVPNALGDAKDRSCWPLLTPERSVVALLERSASAGVNRCTGAGMAYPVVLDCSDLGEAQKVSSRLRPDAQGRKPLPLLRVHAMARPYVDFGENPIGMSIRRIEILSAARALGSLMVDTALLDIARGAVITVDDSSLLPESFGDQLRSYVEAHGFQLRCYENHQLFTQGQTCTTGVLPFP